MKYSEMKYVRPDIDKVCFEFKALINDFTKSKSPEEADLILEKINTFRNHFKTMEEIAYINYTIDTNNKKFEDEQNYFDEVVPSYKDLENEYYKALVSAEFRNDLTEKYGKHLFELAENTLKSFSHEIIDDVKKENHLKSEYVKLKASA